MKTIKYKFLIAALLCSVLSMAQTKKLDKTFKTNSNVTLNIDATHTNVVVEPWDRNEVLVEAFLDMPKAEKEELNKALKDWKLDLSGSAGEVTIRSTGAVVGIKRIDMASLDEPLSKLPEMMAPLQEMIGPLLESISGNPLPPEFYEKMDNVKFDYQAYRKEGDAYLSEFEKKMEKNFGKDFEKSMEEWAANFEKDHEKMTKKLEKDMEAWGEDFGKSMEAWGEQFGKDMEAWAANLEKEVEAKYGNADNKVIIINKGAKAQKTLKIKMPKDGQLKLNVRHGDVKLNGHVKNLRGQLSHSNLSAGTISGEKTDLNIAYTPIKVKQWDYGMLKASYVQDLSIDKAVSIKLTSNSSDVVIKELAEQGILRGSFGELVIDKLGNNFKSIDIMLENSDLKLDLPDVAYNIQYTGTKSQVKFPESLKLKSSKSYDTEKLNGFNGNKNANATISITANFSDVLLK
ncbi:hypothetical protein SAMN04488034_10463 [Salinimicrobium catena]|uniref:Uncharacterized protein n=1 Tax=Salinimicrobium catena TaxID=390640 RepID=A0A1H5NC33_9FLAO|nr:hypothetical protein [Salinimicrobium catena]SDL42715.1 hypothetical protein SAMN04488140_10463 [Salinimicrobium catena]SEE99202.1 hypothetical protein SAMN04488034_10463 [Salinimicrobium catena]